MPAPTLFLAAVLPLLAQAPGQPSREEMHKRFTEKVNDPAEVKRIVDATNGCNIHEGGESGQNYRTQMAGGTVNRVAARVAAEGNPILPADRTPKLWPAAERKDASALTGLLEDGKATAVASLKGKVVVVFVYKAECKWTAEVMNEVIKLQGMETKAPFAVLPLSVGEGGWPKIAEYRRKNTGALPDTFKIYRPSAEEGKGISALGAVEYTPAIFILDRQGRVAWRIYGGVKGAIQDRLNHLLSE